MVNWILLNQTYSQLTINEVMGFQHGYVYIIFWTSIYKGLFDKWIIKW
jgi:hypothetical protein